MSVRGVRATTFGVSLKQITSCHHGTIRFLELFVNKKLVSPGATGIKMFASVYCGVYATTSCNEDENKSSEIGTIFIIETATSLRCRRWSQEHQKAQRIVVNCYNYPCGH
jgi:hypothetical protein